ncbi:T9SS type A sorting domain-containing protein [candidate division TA06 bacterium]|uniref:T9SS type A sorting domain-containing protein n=1 Tax=candidate division TA06 bacterium TaxID=2250710 RepID=A0A933I7A4_UNCT6|nr:T9SS type A sorting domain-containing protein [candidate division TA06 bacterium]
MKREILILAGLVLITAPIFAAAPAGYTEVSALGSFAGVSEYATAGNWGRKLVKGSGSYLYLTYVDVNDSIRYAFSNNNGTDWYLRMSAIGHGYLPVIAVNPATNYPIILWLEGQSIKYSKNVPGAEPDWTSPVEIASIGNAGSGWGAPTLTVTSAGIAHYVWAWCDRSSIPINGYTISGISHGYFNVADDPATMTIEKETIGDGGDEGDFRSPSLAIDTYDTLHLVYRNGAGDISYCYRGPDGWADHKDNVSAREYGENCETPFAEFAGTEVWVAWAMDNPVYPGYYETRGRPRDIANPAKKEWYGTEGMSRSNSEDSRFPTIAYGTYGVYQDSVSDYWEVFYRKRLWEDNPAVNVSESPTVNSRYAHTVYWNAGGNGYLGILWTEGNGPACEVKFRRFEFTGAAAPAYEPEVGGAKASPFTLSRDGSKTYSPISIDYSYTELVYRLPYLNPLKKIQLVLVAYQNEPGAGEWQQRAYIDNTAERLIKFKPGVPETVKIWLPAASYKDDKEVILRVKRIKGDFAAIAHLGLYEFERDEETGGGAQLISALTTSPVAADLSLQNSPNPFKQLTTINYQLATPGQVSLKIYNISGRLVKTLADRVQGAGEHSVKWDGRDDNGKEVANGVYFYRLNAGPSYQTKRMILLK